jgi:uncharacterized protein
VIPHDREIAAGDRRQPFHNGLGKHALLRLVWQRYIPNRVLLLAAGDEGEKQLARRVPSVATVKRKQGRATAYIFENYVCNLPTADPLTVVRLLDGSQTPPR